MNGDRLEQLVLSGELFNGTSRSSSPARSASPDAPWPPGSRSDDGDDGSDVLAELEGPPRALAPAESIGMGPGRTGVKGVIRDRDEAARREREGRARDARELARRMEKASLGGLTWAEEEKVREKERGDEEKSGMERGMERRGRGMFGYLREVGVAGFLPAIEEEERSVSVVVHIYEPSLDRCDALDDVLVRLARLNPQTKFIRVRASAIGYAISSAPSRRTLAPPSNAAFLSRAARLLEEDEDDPYGAPEPEVGEEEYEEDLDDVEVDTDMLPTMHVYRAGELVHNWVRVDWEAGKAGVEDLLEKHHVLESQRNAGGGLRILDDVEDELQFGEPDER